MQRFAYERTTDLSLVLGDIGLLGRSHCQQNEKRIESATHTWNTVPGGMACETQAQRGIEVRYGGMQGLEAQVQFLRRRECAMSLDKTKDYFWFHANKHIFQLA